LKTRYLIRFWDPSFVPRLGLGFVSGDDVAELAEVTREIPRAFFGRELHIEFIYTEPH
jgi:hypothetical protein